MQPQNSQLHYSTIFTTDLYQFTCSYSYFMSNKHEQQATFEVFFRKYPFGGKYTILGGIRAVKEFLDRIQFTPDMEEFLLGMFPYMKKEYFQWLRNNIKKSIQIKSCKEGEIVFAKEPLITYTGPISIVQLLETPILNLIGFSSLVATNASRMAKIIEPKKCVEFGIRRAQGPDGGLSASQFAYLGGFIGTSNVYASQKLKIPCYGTMSHAYVTSFSNFQQVSQYELNGVKIVEKVKRIKQQLKLNTHQGQLAAFTMFAKSFPNNFVTLIDTYSTIDSGLINTIIVAKALSQAGIDKFGLRLDSGDLSAQSIKCREIWNKYFPNGPKLNILASDDLHEDRLLQMVQKGNQIDVFAIGTHIATCKKQPALGLVCKLVQLNGQPKMKFSQDGQKATYPSKKCIYRIWTKQSQQSQFDLISLEKQQIGNKILVVDPDNKYQKKQVEIKKIKLLNNYWDKQAPFDSLQKCRQYLNTAKTEVKATLQIKNPKSHSVKMTQQYHKVLLQTLERNRIAKQNAQK